MAPAKRFKDIKLTVPRHNSQRVSPKLSVEVRKQAKSQGVRVQIVQPSSRLAQSIESASEWNSLLITARAERGPQWDVGTQQFLVDKYSEHYYDPTPLFQAVRKTTEDEIPDISSSRVQPLSHLHLQTPTHHPHHPHHPHHAHPPPTQIQQQHTFHVHRTPSRTGSSSGSGPGPGPGGSFSMPMHAQSPISPMGPMMGMGPMQSPMHMGMSRQMHTPRREMPSGGHGAGVPMVVGGGDFGSPASGPIHMNMNMQMNMGMGMRDQSPHRHGPVSGTGVNMGVPFPGSPGGPVGVGNVPMNMNMNMGMGMNMNMNMGMRSGPGHAPSAGPSFLPPGGGGPPGPSGGGPGQFAPPFSPSGDLTTGGSPMRMGSLGSSMGAMGGGMTGGGPSGLRPGMGSMGVGGIPGAGPGGLGGMGMSGGPGPGGMGMGIGGMPHGMGMGMGNMGGSMGTGMSGLGMGLDGFPHI